MGLGLGLGLGGIRARVRVRVRARARARQERLERDHGELQGYGSDRYPMSGIRVRSVFLRT